MAQPQTSTQINELGFADQAGASAVSWPAVLAGATVAIATTIILATLATGFGLATISPWKVQAAPIAFTIGGGIWLVVMQWLSSALGGYISGRLRTRWSGVHVHEVFFRDTAHGLLTWAAATIVVSALALHGAAAAVDTSPRAALDAAEIAAAQKSSAAFAIFTAISMLVGAFIACVSAALGGRLRDEHP